MPSILFICTGNLYRSPISAAAFMQKLKEHEKADQWVVGSAGTWTQPDQPVRPEAVRVARDLGLDIETHKTRLVDAQILSTANLVLVMEEGHKEALLMEFPFLRGRIHLISVVADQISYDIPDPANAGTDLKVVARQLCDLVERGYSRICELAGKVSVN